MLKEWLDREEKADLLRKENYKKAVASIKPKVEQVAMALALACPVEDVLYTLSPVGNIHATVSVRSLSDFVRAAEALEKVLGPYTTSKVLGTRYFEFVNYPLVVRVVDNGAKWISRKIKVKDYVYECE